MTRGLEIRRLGRVGYAAGLAIMNQAAERLRSGDWPGNVRQLENAVARLVALSAGGEIGAEALSAPPPRLDGEEPSSGEDAGAGIEGATLREQLDALERSLISRMLAKTGGNQSEAARRLGLSRTALIDRLKKYGLS